jgi:UDP:flavonoid glycosyltransferase YjiC (YdhE family)
MTDRREDTTGLQYLFTLVDGGGTVPPELGAAQRLVERGHRVTVLAEDSMEADVHASGAEFRRWTTAPNRASRLPDDDPYRDWECKSPLSLFARILERQFVGPAAAYAADTMAAIDELHPALVVSSMFALGSMVGAEARGVPFDILLANPYPFPAPGLPQFGMGLKPARGPAGRARDRLLTALISRQWAKGLAPLNELRTSLGLDPVASFFDQFHHARRELVLTSADFDFVGDVLPSVRYVGPVLDDPAWAAGAPWTPPPGDDPLVLVALSSTFQDHIGCLQRIIDALGTLPVRGVVTTGPAVDPSSLRSSPDVSVVAAAPHSEVLRHAALAVTHGGHGTVMRCLAADVPMVLMPHGRDQGDNATRVVLRGAGVELKRTASAAAIASAVGEVLADPRFRTAAAELGGSIRRDGTSAALVDELEGVRPVTCSS